MSFQLREFGVHRVPEGLPRTPVGTAPTASRAMALPGGQFWDGDQDEQAPQALPWQLDYAGSFYATNALTLPAQVDAWRKLRGQRAVLVREMDESAGIGGGGARVQWCWARLLQVKADREARHREIQPASISWLIESSWYGSAHNDLYALDTPPASSAYTQSFFLTNITNRPIVAMKLTLTPGPLSTLTKVVVRVRDMGGNNTLTECEYTGQCYGYASAPLVIDCGARAVTNNGTNDYAHFALTANHTMAEWFYVPAEAGAWLDIVRTATAAGEGDLLSLAWTDEYE